MLTYILHRLLLMIPTVLGIMIVSFAVIQFAPGGPVERAIAQLNGAQQGGALSGVGGDFAPGGGYEGARGLDPEIVKKIEAQYGFDAPPAERFVRMMKSYLTLDFGDSYFREASVIDLVAEKLPVSISLAVWTILITYAVSIPLGIAKAVRPGSPFDLWTSAGIIFAAAIPGFMVGVLLLIVFAGGSFLDLFPLRGLVSDNWAAMSWPQRIADYFWHLALPITAMTLNGFAARTFFTKNAFQEELAKQYVLTARAKGLSERRVLYGHVFRNAMLLVIATFPAALIATMLSGSLLIETIFSLDGIGLLAFDAVQSRDYPVVFGTLFVFSVIGLLVTLLGDVLLAIVDPRIGFSAAAR